ncbi:glutamate--cysteine ligase [Thermaurantiacus sp.]
MTTRTEGEGDAALIEGFADLVSVFERGAKPKACWRIGTEHEKFVFRLADRRAPGYDEPGGIRDLLLAFTGYGWQPVEETGKVIALKGADGAISLEPAGQLELSGAPLQTIHETCAEVGRHLRQCLEVGEELGLGFLGLGFHPTATRAELPLMPKGRYAIMRSHMPRVGRLGLDMMLRTCTTQVNLDYASEADMVRKFRVGLALQPVATALFANSPFTEGRPNGYKSFRAHVWTDTDPARTGMLPFVFDAGFGFERYAEYALDVPMYFVYRDGRYIDAAGQSFRDFLAGRLPALPGERPTLGDWKDHLSTAFPEVRMKSFLEMRGADGGPQSRICALPAFWVGLLYDEAALDAAWDLVKGWSMEAREALRHAAARHGLSAPVPGGGTMQALALQVLEIAEAGLRARARLSASGENEAGFLAPMWEMARSGSTLADRHLEAYAGDWGGDITPIFEAARF